MKLLIIVSAIFLTATVAASNFNFFGSQFRYNTFVNPVISPDSEKSSRVLHRGYFEQRLDHFNLQNERRWNMVSYSISFW